MMNIVILAAIWSGNLWDELILKNEISILETRYSNALWIDRKHIQFNVFSYDIENPFVTQENIHYYEYFPIGIKKIKNIVRNIKNFITFLHIIKKTDRVIVWWWGILFDNEMQSVNNPLFQIYFRLKIAHLFKKNIEIFRVWINIQQDKNIHKLVDICNLAETISVRDSYSYELLKQLNFSEKTRVEKDPVFFDRVSIENEMNRESNVNTSSISDMHNGLQASWKYLDRSLLTSDFTLENIQKTLNNVGGFFTWKKISWMKIWIALRQQNIQNYRENIIEICTFLQKMWAILTFIPHSFHPNDPQADDFEWLKSLKTVCEQNWWTSIHICTTLEESYYIYKQNKVDYIFAQRLHAIILSHVYWIPFLAISYSKKTQEIIEQIKKSR